MKNHNKAFGIVLRDVRMAKGLTQDSLSYITGVDRTYISLLELGSSSPTLDKIMPLCEGLQISFSQFAALLEAEMGKE